jgi:predicted transcriptional regulator
MRTQTTATAIRALRAERCNRREIALFLGVSQSEISGALRHRPGETYRDPSGVARYVSTGARVNP